MAAVRSGPSRTRRQNFSRCWSENREPPRTDRVCYRYPIMRYRNLHGTNLQLSELGFGTWTLTTGWWGTYTDDEARRLIGLALDAGVNYIDTADAYGNGRGETMLAPLLKEHPDVIVGTEFIRAAEKGPSYAGVAEAMKGETGKKVCALSSAFDPNFRAWKANPEPQFLIRVTHSSGMLEGQYTLDTKFDESDHRSHRPRSWLVEGVQKVDRLKPICEERGVTIGELALLWLYAHQSVLSALPNIYNEAQLDEFAR